MVAGVLQSVSYLNSSKVVECLTFAFSYGLKEHRHHGEAASANCEDITSERKKLKEDNARFKPEDRFNADESYINPFNPPD